MPFVASSDGEPQPKRSRLSGPDADNDSDVSESNLSQNPGFTSDDTSPANGIIERVILKNFLCHTFQDVSFGPKVNFLIGNNGSGKSSVLTAVVVGLGGKATATNRGQSIKNFIKHGKNKAEVNIYLRNQGPDAFKPDVFGKKIIVQRQINKNGVHGAYVMKDATGKRVCHKKEELCAMLDHFNIQVDNPVSILTQDTCKNFLHSKSGTDKYTFFMRATQLEQMKENYTQANSFKDRARETFETKADEVPELEKEVKQWKAKLKSFDAIEDLRHKLTDLKNDMAWAIVIGKGKEIKPLRQSLEQEQERLPKFEKFVVDKTKQIEVAEARHHKLKEQIKQMSVDIEHFAPQRTKLKCDRDDKKQAFKLKQREMEQVRRDLQRAKKEKGQIEERIKEIENSVQKDFEASRQKREETIAARQVEMEALEAKLTTNELMVGQHKAAVTRGREDLARLRTDERDVIHARDQVSAEIRDLESTRSNRLKRFGDYMPELVRQIDVAVSQGLFHKKPKGPLGAAVSLKDQRWAVAVEVCLEGQVRAFCCHDHHDEKQLEMIMSRVVPSRAPKPATITSLFTTAIYDVSRHKAVSSYPTVLDMLDTRNADPVVINTLIDQRGIENILLIETQAEVRHVMSGDPPRNVKMAYTAEGDHAFCKPSFRYYSLPHEKTSSVLTTNVEETLSRLRQRLARARSDCDLKHGEVKVKEREVNEELKQERIHLSNVNGIKDKIAHINLEIMELKSAIEEETAPDITALEEDVARYDDHIATYSNRIRTIEEKLKAAQAEFEEADKAYTELDEKIRHVTSQSDPVQEEFERVAEELTTAKKHKVFYEDKLNKQVADINEIANQLAFAEAEYQKSVETASMICDERKPRRTYADLEKEINAIQRQIATEEKTRGNYEDVKEKYTERLGSLKRIQRDIRHMEKLLEKLDDVLDIRMSNYFNFRKIIALRCKYFFVMSLSQRRYQGKLSFDHPGASLTLVVQPLSQQAENGNSKDLRSLSGGERSFSTVCFILALWDAIESPFRMMDEFDIYMDMVNRRVSMDMLQDAALSAHHRNRQFIFLTPQAMTKTSTNDVRILRMRTPERGQQTIEFHSPEMSRAASSATGTEDSEEE